MNVSENLTDHSPAVGQDSSDVHEAVLNVLGDRIAILDSRGWITWVNRAWKNFAIRPDAPPYTAVEPGVNYLNVCREAAREHTVAHDTLYGIYSVLEGLVDLFSLEYNLASGETGPCWFLMTASPIREGIGGLVLSHREITAHKQAEQARDQLGAELQSVKTKLAGLTDRSKSGSNGKSV